MLGQTIKNETYLALGVENQVAITNRVQRQGNRKQLLAIKHGHVVATVIASAQLQILKYLRIN